MTVKDNKITKDNNNSTGNIMLKVIAFLVFVFLIFIIVSTVIAYYNGAFAVLSYHVQIIEKNGTDSYNFVYCLHELTNTVITYPEGTYCDIDEQIEKGDIFDEDEGGGGGEDEP